MRVRGCTIVAVITLLAFPASAAAGWSSPRSVSAPGAGSPALAVNAHGQSAIFRVEALGHSAVAAQQHGTKPEQLDLLGVFIVR